MEETGRIYAAAIMIPGCGQEEIAMKHPFKILINVLCHTGADKFLLSYVAFFFADAALIWLFEPTFTSYRTSLWYCYAVVSTAGFGDVVVTTAIPRILSVVLTAYSVLIIAIVTGVVVNYYTQMIEMKNKETLSSFLDRLERLPELSGEELESLSASVRHFRRTGKREPDA